MSARSSILSTSEMRKPLVAASAMREFARGGFHGTTVAAVASDAGISPAYVFKLFPSKEQLFVVALDEGFARILQALREGADASADQSPEAVLDAMGLAYAQLISDRTLLILQVHAQSVAEIPEIGQALRNGLKAVTEFAQSRSGASDKEIQHFIAFGQLCHLIVTLGLEDVPEHWARMLSEGVRHF